MRRKKYTIWLNGVSVDTGTSIRKLVDNARSTFSFTRHVREVVVKITSGEAVLLVDAWGKQ